nr:hypothetical protein CFP56_63944 [Quercus suber]
MAAPHIAKAPIYGYLGSVNAGPRRICAANSPVLTRGGWGQAEMQPFALAQAPWHEQGCWGLPAPPSLNVLHISDHMVMCPFKRRLTSIDIDTIVIVNYKRHLPGIRSERRIQIPSISEMPFVDRDTIVNGKSKQKDGQKRRVASSRSTMWRFDLSERRQVILVRARQNLPRDCDLETTFTFRYMQKTLPIASIDVHGVVNRAFNDCSPSREQSNQTAVRSQAALKAFDQHCISS